MNTKIQQFIKKADDSIDKNTLHKIIISNPNNKKDDLKKIIIRPIEIKQELMLTFLYTYQTKDITKNYNQKESLIKISELFDSFSDAILFSKKENVEIKISNKKILLKLLKPTITAPPHLAHNRKKERHILPENNIYLKELKVVSQDNKVIHSKYDKFRQINKFVEIIDNLVSETELEQPITIIDMGSGKGYLTFAIYDYLCNSKKLKVYIKGVEAREELVLLCNNIAQKAQFDNLKFEQGYIGEYDIKEMDVLIALHACDTATDEAIFKGITNNAKIIICSPCCHKQIRKQITINNRATAVLKHGILAERQAELITDEIRSLILALLGFLWKW